MMDLRSVRERNRQGEDAREQGTDLLRSVQHTARRRRGFLLPWSRQPARRGSQNPACRRPHSRPARTRSSSSNTPTTKTRAQPGPCARSRRLRSENNRPVLDHPGMSERRLRLESTFRIPSETFGDKVDEEVVVCLEDLGERLCAWATTFAFGVDDGTRGSLGVCAR
jgi:hypothetical protein